ncbi:MAG: UDP-N-acetylglucosamine 1-carboxyvinyltransferase [Anaerolineales bacterium]|jgi:UDP-N-acetylglucosamine 1-carboxyvinyltransferase
MEKLIIEGRHPLKGEITPGGNKNAALPILAACLLTEKPVTLFNVPQIQDVLTMKSLLESLGAKIEIGEQNVWHIQAKDVRSTELDPELLVQIRASILLAGPMMVREGDFRISPPGGDIIGQRRVDTHILALNALGAEAAYDREEKVFHFKAPKGLKGANILLDEASVTATENAIMAAVLSKGETIISNAASEPHIQDLCNFLNILGADIHHIGSNVLHIRGVSGLGGGEFTIGPDYLEVVSYIGAAVVTHGSIRIKNAGPEHLGMIKLVFNRLGTDWEVDGKDVIVPEEQSREIEPDLGNAIPRIGVMPWPAFPTDLMSIAIVVATQAKGSVLFHDWMYPSRMFFTDKLVSMGAKIVLCDPHRAIIQGPSSLFGENLESPDIRAGMALVLAALAAKGQSVIRNINQIDRGYEKVDEKLKTLGAHITRKAE